MKIKIGPEGANFCSMKVGNLRPARQLATAEDYGDDGTIGAYLRRTGSRRAKGIFLGCHNGIWVVGVTKRGGTEFKQTEVYSSAEDMRRDWMLEEGQYGMEGQYG